MGRAKPITPKRSKETNPSQGSRAPRRQPVALKRVQSSHVRHQIVVPTHLNPVGDNDPVPVSTDILDRIKEDLVLLTGGVTVHGPAGEGVSAVAGVWVGDGGRLYAEPVLVITADGRAEVAPLHGLFLRRIGSWIATELGQETVYYTSHPIEVEFLSKPSEKDADASPRLAPADLEEALLGALDVSQAADLKDKCLVAALHPWAELVDDGNRIGILTLVSKELVDKYEPALSNDAFQQFTSLTKRGHQLEVPWVTIEGEIGGDYRDYAKTRK